MIENAIGTHDVYVRMTVRKTVTGVVTPQKKHKAVRAARHAFDRRPGYTVVSAEVSAVTEGRKP
jgi:hypothetical protein